MRTQCDVFRRIQLLHHIQHPDHPENVEQGGLLKEIKAAQNVMGLKIREIQDHGAYKNDAPANEAQYVLFANVRNRKLYHTNYFLTQCRIG